MNTKHTRSKSSAYQNNGTSPGTPQKFLANDDFLRRRQQDDDDDNHDDMYDYFSGKENAIFRCTTKELPTSGAFRLEVSPAWTEDSDDKDNKTRKERDFGAGFYCSLSPRKMESPDTCIYWEEKLDSSSDSVSKICS